MRFSVLLFGRRMIDRLTDCCGIEAETENESRYKEVIVQSELCGHKSAGGVTKTQEDNLDNGEEDSNADESVPGVLVQVGLGILRSCSSHIATFGYT